ncbi:uncharacterized protein BCN122_II2128 [Burkholderia cenocepacia]|nr:uncharacterized protein BCN122_I2900 [Burkholderia cenocepacia]ARF88871.1 uncharacterized protein BCN122_II2128 [Burkholderia cenocepacia]
MEKRIVFPADFKCAPSKQQVAALLTSCKQRVVCRSFVETSA